VHSSADLYGSDRSLLDLITESAKDILFTVALPETGLLMERLGQAGVHVVVAEVGKIDRRFSSWRGAVSMPRTLVGTIRSLEDLRVTAGPFDIVYSNTAAVFGGALAARRWKVPHVWHIREILDTSRWVTLAYRTMVRRLADRVICNSEQTRQWIGGTHAAAVSYDVVWNGCDAPSGTLDRRAARERFSFLQHEVVVVLAGRINAWKGHHLVIDAFLKLPTSVRRNVRIVFAGSAYRGQEHFEEALRARIDTVEQSAQISVVGFQNDLNELWRAADFAVVPSTRPEPFGRVAIEAMACGLPVVAAAHGGLTEIVQHARTGLLFKPGDADSLAEALGALIADPSLRASMGSRARERHRACFTRTRYAAAVRGLLLDEAHRTRSLA